MTHLDAFADGLEAAKSGDRLTARRQFQQVAEMAPDFTPGLVWLAWTSDSLTEAADYLEQAERLAPNSQLVANYRSVMEALTDFELSSSTTQQPVTESQVAVNVQGLSAEIQSHLNSTHGGGVSTNYRDVTGILVVDDNPAVRRILRMTLTAAGYEVKSASSGAAALEVLDEYVPQLMLVDVSMPQMDGYQFCRQVRMRSGFRETPFIMLSAKDGTFDAQRGATVGCSQSITKPFQAADLLELVVEVLDGQASHQQRADVMPC